jgi:tetratricopeptide (TPR) repeat protein
MRGDCPFWTLTAGKNMANIPDLEFSIHQRNEGIFTIEGRFFTKEEVSEKRLGVKRPIEMRLDFPALHDSLADMRDYGQILSDAFFVPDVKNFFLECIAAAGERPLRFRLSLDTGAPELYRLHWESLLNPQDGTLIAADQNILFSRYLAGESWKSLRLQEQGNARVLVAVANPSDLPNYKLAPVDVEGETARALAGLAGIETSCLPSETVRCTLSALMKELRNGYDILYLVAHGTLVNGTPYLWLENDEGKVDRVSGRDFAAQVSGLSIPPCLVVLASCESAGKSDGIYKESQPLDALGPLLSEAGVPAVVAMQGKISMSSVADMMPVFFEELLKDGVVDRALATARSIVIAKKASDAWMPVLFSRLASGKVWKEEKADSLAVSIEKVVETTMAVGGNITDSNIVVGDGNQVNVQHGVPTGFLRNLSIWQWIGFASVVLAIVMASLFIISQLKPKQKPVMTGEFRIAIASFAEQGSDLPDKAGYTIASGIQDRLSDDLREITVGPKVEIWGPDRIGTIKGRTPEERAQNAAILAKEIQAYMVIYGLVESIDGQMYVTPEFYLDTQGFSEGSEIIGQYELVSTFFVAASNNPAWFYDFNRKMYTRSDVISSFATGLSYFAIQDYETALEIFQKLDSLDTWDDIHSRKVLYALLGFSAGKVGDYELTETMLHQSLEIDPEYARPYIGLANVAYMRSLLPFQESKNPADIDFSLLQECDAFLEKARQAKNKPPLAEVETKIHFAQGQCSMMTTYSGNNDSFDWAVQEFEQVITAYDNGKNTRVQELAGEAYARLALIYSLTGSPEQAGQYYQKAADTLKIISTERAKLYQERANAILGIIPTP